MAKDTIPQHSPSLIAKLDVVQCSCVIEEFLRWWNVEARCGKLVWVHDSRGVLAMRRWIRSDADTRLIIEREHRHSGGEEVRNLEM